MPTAESLFRWTWSTYPNTAVPAAFKKDTAQTQQPLPELVVPLACLHTPLKDVGSLPRIPRDPTRCCKCLATLNLHCHLDVVARYWACCFCLTRNPLPPQYDECTASLSEFVVQRASPNEPSPCPIFVLILDTALPQDQLEGLKTQVQRIFQLLPPNSYVGLITFGDMATVWELGYAACSKCYTLRGHREYTEDEIKEYLGLRNSDVMGRFLVPLVDFEFAINAILDDIQPDPYPAKVGMRPSRCTGSAIQLAVGVLSNLGQQHKALVGRVMLFVGGVSTKGPGAVVGLSRTESIRSQKDIADGNAPLMNAAKDFYSRIERRLIALSYAMDILIGSLDQVGLLEMSDCVNNTGGNILNTESFLSQAFNESIGRMFKRGMYYCATLEIFTSRETQISGVIGPVHNTHKPSHCVSQKETGHGGTSQWQMSVIDADTTLAIYFDTAIGDVPDSTTRYVQCVTTYVTASGEHVVRVATYSQPVANTLDAAHYVQSNAFDQECAAVITARRAVDILSQNDNKIDLARRWVDRVLVTLLKRFAQYVPNTPESVRLAPSFSLFPSFMYHLRRSEFFLIFNMSPDEMTYKRHYLNREPCDHCVTMIQPTLQAYTCECPVATPVPLDSVSSQVDNVLLLDSFFEVVVHYGNTMMQWKTLEYHKNPEYANFARALAAPVEDAKKLLEMRFPFPTYIETEQHGSQARFLVRYLNPTTTHSSGVQDSRTLSNPYATGVQEVIYTDDASLQKFLASLKVVVTQAERK